MRFVIDATENNKEGGVAAAMCSSQTGLWTKSKGNVLLILPGSPKWCHFRRGHLWTSSKDWAFVFIRLFRIRGPISTWKGRREGGRGVLNEEARVAASCQKIKSGHKVNEPRRAFLFVFLLMIWTKNLDFQFLSRSYTISRRKLIFTAIFQVLPTDQFDAFFNPKNASETNTTNNTPSTWKTYELSRHRCF